MLALSKVQADSDRAKPIRWPRPCGLTLRIHSRAGCCPVMRWKLDVDVAPHSRSSGTDRCVARARPLRFCYDHRIAILRFCGEGGMGKKPMKILVVGSAEPVEAGCLEEFKEAC